MVRASPVRPRSGQREGTPGKEIKRMWGVEFEQDNNCGPEEERDEIAPENFKEFLDEEDNRLERIRVEGRGQMINWENYENEQDEQGEGSTREEGVKPKYKSVEPRPTKKEVEEHMLTHIPYRSWCPHCVRGKARASYHKQKDKGERHVPTVSMDYMYMESDKSEERGMPMLVFKDNDSGWTSARVVPKKRELTETGVRVIERRDGQTSESFFSFIRNIEWQRPK